MNTPKKLDAALAPMYAQYGFIGPESIEHGGKRHLIAVLVSISGRTVRVQGIPCTTSTPIKFVAQNVLKVARNALQLDRYIAAYGGGK